MVPMLNLCLRRNDEDISIVIVKIDISRLRFGKIQGCIISLVTLDALDNVTKMSSPKIDR